MQLSTSEVVMLLLDRGVKKNTGKRSATSKSTDHIDHAAWGSNPTSPLQLFLPDFNA